MREEGYVGGERERKRITFPFKWDPKRARDMVLMLSDGLRTLFYMNYSDSISISELVLPTDPRISTGSPPSPDTDGPPRLGFDKDALPLP